LLFQTVNNVNAMDEYAWSKALRRRDKTPGAFFEQRKALARILARFRQYSVA
jgi:hypothetical protein